MRFFMSGKTTSCLHWLWFLPTIFLVDVWSYPLQRWIASSFEWDILTSGGIHALMINDELWLATAAHWICIVGVSLIWPATLPYFASFLTTIGVLRIALNRLRANNS